MADPYQKIKDDCAAVTGDRMLGVGFFQPKSGAMTAGAGLEGGGNLLFRLLRRRENAQQGPPMTLLGVSQRAVHIFESKTGTTGMKVARLVVTIPLADLGVAHTPNKRALLLDLTSRSTGQTYQLAANAKESGAQHVMSLLSRTH
jgi:hypothetical protein